MTIYSENASGVFPFEEEKEERRISIWWERALEGPIDSRNLGVGPFGKKNARLV